MRFEKEGLEEEKIKQEEDRKNKLAAEIVLDYEKRREERRSAPPFS